jgi:hypothetical protein
MCVWPDLVLLQPLRQHPHHILLMPLPLLCHLLCLQVRHERPQGYMCVWPDLALLQPLRQHPQHV